MHRIANTHILVFLVNLDSCSAKTLSSSRPPLISTLPLLLVTLPVTNKISEKNAMCQFSYFVVPLFKCLPPPLRSPSGASDLGFFVGGFKDSALTSSLCAHSLQNQINNILIRTKVGWNVQVFMFASFHGTCKLTGNSALKNSICRIVV